MTQRDQVAYAGYPAGTSAPGDVWFDMWAERRGRRRRGKRGLR